MIEALLSWPPILWTLRAVVGILLLLVGWLALMLLVRCLWPPNAWALLTRKMPDTKEWSVRLNLLGQEVAANGVLDIERDQQVRDLAAALAKLEESHASLQETVEDMKPDWR